MLSSWCDSIPAEEQGTYPIDQSDGGEDDDPQEHAEWAKSLIKNPLTLEIGTKAQFPALLRTFERGANDAIILDDVRGLAFLSENHEKLQAKYNAGEKKRARAREDGRMLRTPRGARAQMLRPGSYFSKIDL